MVVERVVNRAVESEASDAVIVVVIRARGGVCSEDDGGLCEGAVRFEGCEVVCCGGARGGGEVGSDGEVEWIQRGLNELVVFGAERSGELLESDNHVD